MQASTQPPRTHSDDVEIMSCGPLSTQKVWMRPTAEHLVYKIFKIFYVKSEPDR